ncbi:thioredoxin family protein [Spirosoma daeguense]
MIAQQPVITTDLIESALTYEQYVALSAELLAQGHTTSDAPAYNTPEIVGYARLNLHRMSRLDKLTVINDELKEAVNELTESLIWVVLTESWCGDAAQSVPVLNHVARLSSKVKIRFLLRDKNPDVMNAYLTNGGKSIPKLICFRESDLNNPVRRELGTWGPRPDDLQLRMNEWKTENLPFTEAIERAQRWYNDDRTQSIQRELLALVKSW